MDRKGLISKGMKEFKVYFSKTHPRFKIDLSICSAATPSRIYVVISYLNVPLESSIVEKVENFILFTTWEENMKQAYVNEVYEKMQLRLLIAKRYVTF